MSFKITSLGLELSGCDAGAGVSHTSSRIQHLRGARNEGYEAWPLVGCILRVIPWPGTHGSRDQESEVWNGFYGLGSLHAREGGTPPCLSQLLEAVHIFCCHVYKYEKLASMEILKPFFLNREGNKAFSQKPCPAWGQHAKLSLTGKEVSFHYRKCVG